jgi:AcrR family transcriptional regulator
MGVPKERDPSEEAAPDRRTRLRAWTREEIKAAALRQLAEHGVEGLSLNAIAKELGMTGPALYQYVTSRDELLADLVVDAWEELADALERAAEENAETTAASGWGRSVSPTAPGAPPNRIATGSQSRRGSARASLRRSG